MLAIVATLAFVQISLAALAPARFISISLLIQAIPFTWNLNVDSMVSTPLGAINVIAIQLFALCVACLVVVLKNFEQFSYYMGRFKWHGIFIAYCVVSLIYAPSGSYGVRMIAKLLGPMLFMASALVAINTERQLRDAGRAILWSGVILAIMAFIARGAGISSDPNAVLTGFSGLGPPGMGPPVFAAHMLPVAMLALAVSLETRSTATIGMTLLAAFCVIGAFQRTSAAALFVGCSAITFLGTRGFVRLLLPISGVLGLPLLIIFNSNFRQRMFFDAGDSQALLKDPLGALQGINGSGRFSLWDEMLTRFYTPHPAIGSGIGATQEFLYSRSAIGQGVVHSEYVRLLCELGVIGLVLFSIAMLSYLITLVRFSRLAGPAFARTYALAAVGGLVTYLIYMTTDNSFDYVNQFGAYVFALIAMAVKAREFVRDSTQPATSSATVALANLMR